VVCLCVCLLVSGVSPTKTDEPIVWGVDLGGPKVPRIKYGPGYPWERGTLGGYTWACPHSRVVDILNAIRYETGAMLPLATSTVSTCGYYCGEAVVVVYFHDRLECGMCRREHDTVT